MRETTAISPAWAYLAAAIALGGLSPVIAKSLLAHMPLEALLVWRYALAAAAVAAAGALMPQRIAPRGRPRAASMFALAVVAILGSGVGAFLFTSSLLYAPAAVSNAVSKTGPLFVAFLAYAVLQEQVSLGAASLLAAMLLAAGLLSAGEMRAGEGEAMLPLLGAALAASAGLTRAVAEVAAKAALAEWPPAAVAAARFGGGVLVAAVAVAVRGGGFALPASAADWWLLVFLAVVATAVPLVLYYRAMQALPVHVVAGVRTTAPVVTAIASWALLGERLNLLHWLGIGALLLAAYAMGSIPPARRRAGRMASLSASLVRFVAAVVVVAVLVAGALQAWQLQGLLRRQTRAAVGRSAALIGELLAVSPPAPQPLLRGYLERVVSERLTTPGYVVEFGYLVAVDANNTPLAWAFAPGQRWPPLSPARLASLVVSYGPRALGRRDLLPATVVVSEGGQTVGKLYAGYRASVAVGPFLSVAARTAVLAGVMAALAALAAAGLVKSALGPLAQAASDLLEQARSATVAGPAPSSAGSAAVSPMTAADGAAASALAEWLRSRMTVLPVGLTINAAAAARAPADGLAEWVVAAADAAEETEGILCGAVDGWLICCWGVREAEEDDCLRAYAWAELIGAPIAVVSAGESALDALRRAVADLSDQSTDRPLILATDAFARACGRLQFRPGPRGFLEVTE